MEKVDLDYLRKLWKDELGYYWGRAQKEIDEYFEMIKDNHCFNVKDLKSRSRDQVLRVFSLDEDRLMDPVFIPKILVLLEYIKEINYDMFPDNWMSGDYDNKKHASYIYNTLIPKLKPVANKIIDFKDSQYNNLYDTPGLPEIEKYFINRDFEKYGLIQYEHHLDLINSIAYHKKFYTILPILLRTLFENILHDVFKISLGNRHKLLYFDKKKRRVADFSLLIELLNQLSQYEYKDAIRSNIYEKIIEILDEVKEKGNLTVHEVTRKISKSYANEIQDEIDMALEALLVSYDQLTREDKIIISPERLEKIEEKLGLRKKDEINKEKVQRSHHQDLNKSGLEEYCFLVRLVYLLQKYDTIKDNEREEIETTCELCGLTKKLNIIKFNVEVDLPPGDYFDTIPTEIIVYDKNYEFSFEDIELPNRFVIRAIVDSKTYFSRGYPEYKDKSKSGVLNDFIKYLIDRMEDLRLYSLIEDLEYNERVLTKYTRIQRFIEYLFSDDYLNPTVNKERTDERIISELNWIKQNEKELNDYFSMFKRKDEPSTYEKILSFLNGEYLIYFRNHSPFSSLIKTKECTIEASKAQEIKVVLYKIFEGIKTHLRDNYKIVL